LLETHRKAIRSVTCRMDHTGESCPPTPSQTGRYSNRRDGRLNMLYPTSESPIMVVTCTW